MPCTEPHAKSGMSLVELMIAMTIFSMLSAAIWMNVSLQGRSFLYNRSSNTNVRDAGFLVNRLVYGNDNFWGLRLASRNLTTVSTTDVTGPTGLSMAGWQAVVDHNVDDDNAPSLLDTQVQTYVYNPVTQTITVNGTVIGEQVVDSYLTVSGGDLLLGIQVEEETGGFQSVMETRIRMRNK